MAIKNQDRPISGAETLSSVSAPSSYEDKIVTFISVLVVSSILAFILWPILSVLFESVLKEGKWTFSRYLDLVDEKNLLANSVLVASLSSFIATFIGLSIALYMTHSSGPFKPLVQGTLLLTLISPPFLSSLAYIMLFGRRGLITWKLMGIQWNPYGVHGIVIIESLGFATISAFLIEAVLYGMDRSLEQASLDLGVSRNSTFINITMPLAKVGVITSLLIVFIRSLSDFGTPIIIGGNYTVLATEAYLTAIGSYDLPKAAAMCSLLLVPALAVFWAYRSIMENSSISTGRSISNVTLKTLPLGVELLVSFVTWSFVLFELVKYGSIVAGSVVTTWGVNFDLTLKHVMSLKFSKMDSLIRSIKYSFIAASSVAFLGPLTSWLLRDMRKELSRIVDFMVDLPFILPGTFFGLGYLLAFNWMPQWLLSSGFLVVINCVYRQLTLGVRSGSSLLSQLNPEAENAIRDLGGNRLSSLFDFILPQLKSSITIGFVNTFTASMTTIGAIIFLITPYTKVATVEMFDAVQNGRIGEACSIATIIIAVVLLVNLSFLAITSRKKDRKAGSPVVSTSK